MDAPRLTPRIVPRSHASAESPARERRGPARRAPAAQELEPVCGHAVGRRARGQEGDALGEVGIPRAEGQQCVVGGVVLADHGRPGDAAQRAQLPLESAAMSWLGAIKPRLGDTTTTVTLPDSHTLYFERISIVGFTAAELHLLVDWLESPTFPGGLHTTRAVPPTFQQPAE